MLVIPAVDLRGGNCVMLTQGKIDAETVYSKDPVFISKLWQAKGAKRLHAIDLDGAFQGMPKNLEIIKKMRAAVDIPMQVGGGVRSMKTIDTLFEIGIDYVIVGTIAVYNPDIVRQALDKYGEKIIVAVDVRDNKVAIGGWKDTTPIDAGEIIPKLREMGVKEMLTTDINKDGTLSGPNIEGLRNIARLSAGIRIIASGGVSTIDDIKKILPLEADGVTGVVVGKALYTESLRLEEAIKLTQQE